MSERLYFEIFYTDESIWLGKTLQAWRQFPASGVQVVREVYADTYGNPARHICKRWAGRDYFWMTDDGEIGAHSAKYVPAGAHVKAGEEIDYELFQKIYTRSRIDPNVITR